MAGCARTLYGFQTLRARGMFQASLQLVFRSTAFTKLLYAFPRRGAALLMLAREIEVFSQTSWQIKLLYSTL